LNPEVLDAPLSKPIEQRPDFMNGAMRLVRQSDGSVEHVLIAGKEAFSHAKGFHADLGSQRFGRLLRVS